MEMMSNLGSHGGYDNEVFGLDYYEDQYYTAPQLTSDSGRNVSEFSYNSEYYVQNIQVSYPVIPVIHGGTTYFYYPHVVYLPVYYYVPVYFTYQDPIGVEEPSAIQDSSNEPTGVGCNYACDDQSKEYGIGFDYMSYSSVRVPKQVVNEEITLCYNFEEFPEKLCDAPANSDTEETSSETIIEQDSLSDLNKEDVAVTAEIAPALPRSDSTATEDEDVVCLYDILSSLNILEVKEDMRKNYNNEKNNLYNEVLKGYKKKEKVLKELNWMWDPYLPKIPEEMKRKKTFDMKKYYFDDCIRIPKREPRYEEDSEKYYLYQMLGSLKLSILEGYMEENYDKGKQKRYKRACKGYRTKKKQLKQLKWEGTSLGPISEDEVLEIGETEFKQNFIKDLTNMVLQKDSQVNYLTDELKESDSKFSPVSEEAQKFLNEEALDNQMITEIPPLSMSSSVKIVDPAPVTPELLLGKKGVYFEFRQIVDYPHPPLASPDRMEDLFPDSSTISLNKAVLNCESQKIVEESHPVVSSADRVENGILHAPEVLLREEEVYGGHHKFVDETDFPMNSGDRIENERVSVPDVIELNCESQKIFEESHPAVSSADRVESGILETPEVLLREEEVDGEHHKFIDETEFSMNSGDRIENERVSVPDVTEPDWENKKSNSVRAILEPPAIVAASEINHKKKRFSSLRKFLSRICCCKKTPPS